LRDLGTPALGRRYLETLTEVFGDAVDISIVSDNERPLAGVLALRFKDEITPCYGGAVPAARGRHAYDLLYWSLLSRAAAAGARRFDFGRSELGSGAYAYKLHWGFQPEPLQYQYYLLGAATVPQLDPLNSRYRVPVGLWRRLPLSLANAVGPWVARQIG
jgi:FemAB-related protein (PEP-CTERM system-associated)